VTDGSFVLPERRQLLLPFFQSPDYDSRDFLPATSNQQALSWLEIGWPDQRLALWGPGGCGKSHLLHIWAERVGAKRMIGQTLTDQILDELTSMPEGASLALDDADTVVSEQLLLHVLNTARDRDLRILLSGRMAPARWPICLPDLSSRLRAIVAVEIRPPSDDLLATVLMRLLSDRQLNVAPSVQHWMLTRLPRSPGAMLDAVVRLDRASLAFGKAITRSLAAKVLLEEEAAVEDADAMLGIDPSSQPVGFL
jgi:chromosomal replication initiation ATPase DnaA